MTPIDHPLWFPVRERLPVFFPNTQTRSFPAPIAASPTCPPKNPQPPPDPPRPRSLCSAASSRRSWPTASPPTSGTPRPPEALPPKGERCRVRCVVSDQREAPEKGQPKPSLKGINPRHVKKEKSRKQRQGGTSSHQSHVLPLLLAQRYGRCLISQDPETGNGIGFAMKRKGYPNQNVAGLGL